jgi:ATP-binding cassette, subfamily B, bacterial
MSAGLSARTSQAPTSVPAIESTFERAASIAPPVQRIGPDGSRKQRASDSLWRLRHYLGPYRARFIWSAILAGLGIGATIVVPLVTRAVIDGPIANSNHRGLYALGLFATALGAIEAILMFLRRWVVTRATLGTETAIRTDMYARLQRLPMSFHTRWESGQLLSRIMNDLSTTRRFLGFGLLFIVMSVLQIAVTTGILLHLYWPLGLVVLGSTIPVTWACLRNERAYTAISRQVQDQTGDVASTVEEGAYGLRAIKAFGRAQHMFGKFDVRAVRLHDTSLARVRLSAKFWTFLEVIPSFTLILVLGLGAVAAGQGRLTLGTLVAFLTLLLSLIWPVAALGFLLAMAQEAMTAADRIVEIFDAENDIVDGELTLSAVEGRVRFDGISFRFPNSDADVLHDVDLDIAPGETVAIVGATGSGKTVLTQLVARLYDATAGAIRIDGVDVRDLRLRQLRSVVATAFEDPTLFSMSVRENLTLGRPDATEADIDAAIEIAQAQFVHDLPWGLQTRIGEQGMSLSGGQRQRLALARAVLAQPAVLVLDDTLSSLDIHTEALVEEALKRVLAGVTGIVVAHRASTVLLADRVALLSGGTITQVGTHQELLERVPEYRALLSAEAGSERRAATNSVRVPPGEEVA